MALHVVAALSVEESGEWTWFRVADWMFVFLRLSVTIMQSAREEMSFCVEVNFSKAQCVERHGRHLPDALFKTK